MIRAAVVVLVVVLLGGCKAAALLEQGPQEQVTELTRARFVQSDTAAPPAEDAPGWVPVELPDEWTQRALIARSGWYRLHLLADKPPGEVFGIYLFRLHMNAAVYFNGAFLGDGGRFEEPMARGWNTPLYFTIPPPLWRAGENEVLIRLGTYPGSGLLPPVQIGAERVLRPRYELRRFLQIDVSATLCLGLVGLSLFLLSLWWRRRKDAPYLWLGGACLLWAGFSVCLFVRDPVVPGALLQWFAHSCLDWWIVIFVGFVHRFVGVARPRLERLLQLNAALGMLVTALVSAIQVRGIGFRLFHGVSLAALLYLSVFVLRAWRRRRSPELSLLAAALAFLALAGLHDWLVFSLFVWVPRGMMRSVFGQSFLLFHYAVPLVFSMLAWHLARRFTEALDEAERLNAELEQRVERGRRELERSFAERRLLEREQGAIEARERVYRDLHDDMGAKLLSLVIGAEAPRQADLARAALQDLRDVVSHSTRGQAPLQDLLGDWRSEIEQRAASARLPLTWAQAPDLPELVLRPDVALNLGRVLREAVSNVLRHARAARLIVRVEGREGRLSLLVEDDGVGLGVAPGREGRGVGNMRARAELLGGEIDWREAHPSGCRVELRVPLARLVPQAKDPR